MKKIYIQIWHAKAKVWDDCPATLHHVEHFFEVAQTIADATGQSVRVTYFMEGVRPGNLNGSYYYPNNNQERFNP